MGACTGALSRPLLFFIVDRRYTSSATEYTEMWQRSQQTLSAQEIRIQKKTLSKRFDGFLSVLCSLLRPRAIDLRRMINQNIYFVR